jgi:CRISPR-associated RAMP protein (TIGR02581 family)
VRNRLDRRTSITGVLETVTALHIGAGQPQTAVGTDAPVIRDVLGRPFVPGSSFKGVLRSNLEALLRSSPRGELWTCNPLGDKSPNPNDRPCVTREDRKPIFDNNKAMANRLAEWTELLERQTCSICSLFGSPWLAARVSVPDMPVLGEWRDSSYRVRDGVAIDRENLTAATKYDFETVSPGTRFAFTLIVENAGDWELGIIACGLDLFSQGYATLGGKSSRGLGRVTVSVAGIEDKTARELLGLVDPASQTATGAGLPPVDDASLKQRVEETLALWRKALATRLGQGVGGVV